MCSSDDSFEGVAATFKWLEYKDWERLDLFDTHEHDGLIAQTMRRKANLVFRCFVLIVLSHCKTTWSSCKAGGPTTRSRMTLSPSSSTPRAPPSPMITAAFPSL